jgi:hypothetical protein
MIRPGTQPRCRDSTWCTQRVWGMLGVENRLKVGGGVPPFGRITHALDLANTPGDSAIFVPALFKLRLGLRRPRKRLRSAGQLHRLIELELQSELPPLLVPGGPLVLLLAVRCVLDDTGTGEQLSLLARHSYRCRGDGRSRRTGSGSAACSSTPRCSARTGSRRRWPGFQPARGLPVPSP